MARQHLWTSGQSKPWNLSALVGIEIPTGSPEDYSGQDGAGVQFGFSTDGHIGEDLKLNGQLGYAVRPETHLAGLQLGDELLTGVGLTYQAFESGPVIQSEAKFWFPAADLGKSEATSGDLNLGYLVGCSRPRRHFRCRIRRSTWCGLTRMAGLLGYRYRPNIPALEPTGSGHDSDNPTDLAFQPIARKGDRDGDSWITKTLAHPFRRTGTISLIRMAAPDPDNDLDGVQDVQDAAANAPEDWDGFEDADGVLDADNDQDGIADGEDRCPNQAGAGDGCPGSPMDWVEQIDRLGGISQPINRPVHLSAEPDFLYQRHCSIEQGWRVSDGPSQHIHPNAASDSSHRDLNSCPYFGRFEV